MGMLTLFRKESYLMFNYFGFVLPIQCMQDRGIVWRMISTGKIQCVQFVSVLQLNVMHFLLLRSNLMVGICVEFLNLFLLHPSGISSVSFQGHSMLICCKNSQPEDAWRRLCRRYRRYTPPDDRLDEQTGNCSKIHCLILSLLLQTYRNTLHSLCHQIKSARAHKIYSRQCTV